MYVVDFVLAGLVDQVPEHEAGKVCVEPLVPGDKLIAEAKAGHQSSLLQPENGCKTAGEEDSLHGGEGDHPLGVGGVVGVDPPERPLRLLLDGGECLDSVEELVPLLPVLDVGVDQQAVHLTVDVLHHDLEII